MTHHLVVFEDELWRHFATLVQARPVFALRCGAFSAHERLAAALDAPVSGLCRTHLMGYFGPEGGPFALLHDGRPLLLVNGRARDVTWLTDLAAAPLNTVYLDGETLLGASISPGLASAVLYFLREQAVAEARDELCRFANVVELPPADPPRLISYPWDLIAFAGDQIVRDLPLLQARLPQLVAPPPDVHLRGEHVYVHPSARLDGPLVLDARDGPIFVEANAHIEPFSFVQGPCYIGAGTLIASARIRPETSIGPVCRVGGEVEASTIQGYSNKHHDGFLGHSWLGEWVNIGAMTTNSDLKNTYGSVRVALEGIGQRDSGVLKLGCFLADHVKLGIGLHLNGGTMIGTGSNVFGMHTVPKNIPHFTWGGDVFREYRIDGMIGVARTVMGRRKRELTPAYETLLRAAFAFTRPHRGDMVDAQPAPPQQTAELAHAEAEAVRA
jgi:UDP-N-acetylglucosamine diphosphorylase/glucosamine-1-phosphate N-acetyltransferase